MSQRQVFFLSGQCIHLSGRAEVVAERHSTCLITERSCIWIPLSSRLFTSPYYQRQRILNSGPSWRRSNIYFPGKICLAINLEGNQAENLSSFVPGSVYLNFILSLQHFRNQFVNVFMTDDVDKINVSDRLVLQPGVKPIPVVWRQDLSTNVLLTKLSCIGPLFNLLILVSASLPKRLWRHRLSTCFQIERPGL